MLDVPSIRKAEKLLTSPPKWIDGSDDRLWLTAALDIDGVTVEHLFLRARAFRNRPDEDVLFQLEYAHDLKRRDTAIDRIDWRPIHTHNNKEQGPPLYRSIEQRLSHLSCCRFHGRLLKKLPLSFQIQ